MSTAYRAGLNAIANGDIDWTTADVRAIMISPTYTPDFDTHEDLADVPAGDRYGAGPEAAVTVPTRTTVNVAGVIVECRAGAFTFPSVALHAAEDVVSILFYLHNASEALATLICLDTLVSDVTPDGNNIVITPAATGVFKYDG